MGLKSYCSYNSILLEEQKNNLSRDDMLKKFYCASDFRKITKDFICSEIFIIRVFVQRKTFFIHFDNFLGYVLNFYSFQTSFAV